MSRWTTAARWWRAVAGPQRAKRPPRAPDRSFRVTRDIVGPTGNLFSRGWREIEDRRVGEAYLRSFDPRVPPSLHISSRDRTRANLPIPLSERCLEDIGPTWLGSRRRRPPTPETGGGPTDASPTDGR